MKLLCMIFGHKPAAVWKEGYGLPGMVFQHVECRRCGNYLPELTRQYRKERHVMEQMALNDMLQRPYK